MLYSSSVLMIVYNNICFGHVKGVSFTCPKRRDVFKCPKRIDVSFTRPKRIDVSFTCPKRIDVYFTCPKRIDVSLRAKNLCLDRKKTEYNLLGGIFF